MDRDKNDASHSLCRELRVLTYVLLVYIIFSIINSSYNLVADHIWPRLFSDPFSSSFVTPWPFAFLLILTTAFNVTIAAYSYLWIKAEQSRGWWLSGALFISWIVMFSLLFLQFLLFRVPPDDQPFFMLKPLSFVLVLINLLAGVVMTGHLFRTAVLIKLGIGVEKRVKKLGKLVFYGFILFLAYVLLSVIITSIIAVVLD